MCTTMQDNCNSRRETMPFSSPHDTHFSQSKTLHNQGSRQLWFEMKKMEISYVVCLQQMENFNWKL